MLTSRLPEDQPQPYRLIDQTPADYVAREVARLTEHDATVDTQLALHMTTTALAQVIADDIAVGETAYPPTVARYVEARDRYRQVVADRNASR